MKSPFSCLRDENRCLYSRLSLSYTSHEILLLVYIYVFVHYTISSIAQTKHINAKS